MADINLKGMGVALITPLKEDESVDYEALGKLVDYQVQNGTDYLVVLGTTAETPTLTEEEKKNIISLVVTRVRGRIPIVLGVGGNCTRSVVEKLKTDNFEGIDAILSVVPYYNKPSQEGIYQHYKAIANATHLPIVLYNVPGRTGVNMTAETTLRIAREFDNVIAVKEASGNISQVAKIMQLTDGKIDLYSGNDDQVVPILSLGGSGVISVLSNVAPRETHDMVQKFLDGDVAGAREIQLRALPLIDALFCEVNPIPVKAALNLMGKEVGPLRLPLTEMEPQNQERLAKAMKDFGIKLA